MDMELITTSEVIRFMRDNQYFISDYTVDGTVVTEEKYNEWVSTYKSGSYASYPSIDLALDNVTEWN